MAIVLHATGAICEALTISLFSVAKICDDVAFREGAVDRFSTRRVVGRDVTVLVPILASKPGPLDESPLIFNVVVVGELNTQK